MTTKRTRFTIDMEPAFQKRLKVIAALKGTTMRQYCLDAVENELIKDEDMGRESGRFNQEALEQLFAWRRKEFGDRILPGDSADIIREARELRTADQVRLMDQ
ncbi:MAG: hypothetical protein QGG34_12100 [SAR202 cluster bacterium]|nr:hypothetical protein [SAR202 cluster bacterium]MDP6300826.1 hypothetical protein [SAR202 cluster bacterium]MDP7104531.1 hypothetical protein [SAR202 cluster bacterium]MDP7226200.1 hypothetical protein [SAR202 cluster bacterium]MDP7414455.1 hypothetical protein [SAR202 cluster bacterium]